MTSTRTTLMKARLFGTVLKECPDRRTILLTGIIAALYDGAPENTKDQVDRVIDNFAKESSNGQAGADHP